MRKDAIRLEESLLHGVEKIEEYTSFQYIFIKLIDTKFRKHFFSHLNNSKLLNVTNR